MSVKRNIVANYVGQGWRSLMGLAFVPLYIKYLGIESYGLIGLFAVLQAWLGLLDLGMRPALVREMARFTAGTQDAQSIRNLLRSVEFIGVATAALVGLCIWAASGWLASDWLKAEKLPVDAVARAFSVMGAVTALSFVESIYSSSIIGLQRQVLQNVVSSAMSTARGVGAVCVLLWVSPTIAAFFAWQGFISLSTVFVLAGAVYKTLPSAPRPATFSWPALRGVWRFASGMIVISFLSLLLTQVDKILLSRLLPLGSFAHYALAGTVAGTLYLLVGPITTAFYPRFTELAARRDDVALRQIYHQGAQAVTVLMGGVALVLMAFGRTLLFLWTGDDSLAHAVGPLMTILVLGSLLNGLLWLPYHLQLAHGWTSLSIKINIVAVCVLLPALLWVVPRSGASGAAWVWVLLNSGYLIFTIYFMHRRLLPTEKWRWYIDDIGLPLVSGAAVAGLCRWLIPANLDRVGSLAAISGGAAAVMAVTAGAAPSVRRHAIRILTTIVREIAVRLSLGRR